MLLLVRRRGRRCCATVVVLRSSCVFALCQVGNVHVAFVFNVTDLATFLCTYYDHSQLHGRCGSRSVGFGHVDEKRQRCWCYERCFCWSADVAAAAVLLLLCCCSCATLIMCVSALYSQVVQFHLEVGSCACILPQKSTVLLLCGPTCSSPLKKNASLRLEF